MEGDLTGVPSNILKHQCWASYDGGNDHGTHGERPGNPKSQNNSRGPNRASL